MERFFVAALALAVSACMYSPYDGQHLSRFDDVVQFSGYTDTPGELVSVQVARLLPTPCDDVDLIGVSPLCVAQYEWITIAQVRASSSGTQLFDDGGAWYEWNVSARIPGSLWQHQSATRMEVRTRAQTGGDVAYTVGQDWAQCYSDHHASPVDWRDHCSVGDYATLTTPAP